LHDAAYYNDSIEGGLIYSRHDSMEIIDVMVDRLADTGDDTTPDWYYYICCIPDVFSPTACSR
jgi:hypothetical protein